MQSGTKNFACAVKLFPYSKFLFPYSKNLIPYSKNLFACVENFFAWNKNAEKRTWQIELLLLLTSIKHDCFCFFISND